MNSNVKYKGKVTINTQNKKVVCYNKGTIDLFTTICNLLIGKPDTLIPTYIDLVSRQINVGDTSIAYEPNSSLLVNPLVITYKKVELDKLQLSAMLLKSNIKSGVTMLSTVSALLLDNSKKILAVVSVDAEGLSSLQSSQQASIDWELQFGNTEEGDEQ